MYQPYRSASALSKLARLTGVDTSQRHPMFRALQDTQQNTKQASGVLSTLRKLCDSMDAGAELLFYKGSSARGAKAPQAVLLTRRPSVLDSWEEGKALGATAEKQASGEDTQDTVAQPTGGAAQWHGGAAGTVAYAPGDVGRSQLFDLYRVKVAAIGAAARAPQSPLPPEGRTSGLTPPIQTPQRGWHQVGQPSMQQAQQQMSQFAPAAPTVASASILQPPAGQSGAACASANPIHKFGPIGAGNIANSGMGVANSAEGRV